MRRRRPPTARRPCGSSERRATRRSPSTLVILDLTIPGGIGGLGVLSRLRVIDPAIRAIASSGYSSDTVMAEPRAHGFLDRLAKPYTTVELSEVLSRTLTPRDRDLRLARHGVSLARARGAR